MELHWNILQDEFLAEFLVKFSVESFKSTAKFLTEFWTELLTTKFTLVYTNSLIQITSLTVLIIKFQTEFLIIVFFI